jgi:hypothetical protein
LERNEIEATSVIELDVVDVRIATGVKVSAFDTFRRNWQTRQSPDLTESFDVEVEIVAATRELTPEDKASG